MGLWAQGKEVFSEATLYVGGTEQGVPASTPYMGTSGRENGGVYETPRPPWAGQYREF